MLLIGITFDNLFTIPAFQIIRPYWYIVAYLPVGIPVLQEVWETFKVKDFFTEFSLMSIATIGAFAIGEYPEGVTVMLFYTIGELFQMAAVNRAKRNIKALLDVRAEVAHVFRNGKYEDINPEKVEIGETIQVKAGEKIPLDGELISDKSSFNTAALTGESKPRNINKGESILAGMLNLDKVVEVKVTKAFADSALSRILEMVQNATTRKAKTELFIRKFAKIYTPIVFFLALALVTVPILILGSEYHFQTWLYRSLVFLVISCPCALVISIPLGYFGGIGAASANGILFKGANFLDLITKLNTVVMDKTGTLTKGVFKVQKVESIIDEAQFLNVLTALEAKSTHPIAKAIVEYVGQKEIHPAENIEEIAGMGLKGIVKGKAVLAGNVKLLQQFNIDFDSEIASIEETIVVVAINQKYVGYVLIADEIKEDASRAIQQLHENGIKQVVMLSGDKTSIVKKVAQSLGIDTYFGDLLPEGKVARLEEIKSERSRVVAFVGDGINDTPVLAISDIGIAMGAMGSDAAIETADVVIQTDQPSKIATAIKIGKATKNVVIQNIVLAFAVKAIVLILGAGGLATMWEAVFADVGVAFLAILNAVRIQKMKFL
ncbi:heavy metal translocating P-type ATPase [uncultured Pedobacter sp.]|uniref:heavy metal translocating P-type ATPase n=1 Tax=uncultured Pedobacter sp. TaxID=246139 RepID=UPI0025D0C207|nr:heavy metal translocating P-type ATPase [uncultured Pedobacter sp.]